MLHGLVVGPADTTAGCAAAKDPPPRTAHNIVTQCCPLHTVCGKCCACGEACGGLACAAAACATAQELLAHCTHCCQQTLCNCHACAFNKLEENVAGLADATAACAAATDPFPDTAQTEQCC